MFIAATWLVIMEVMEKRIAKKYEERVKNFEKVRKQCLFEHKNSSVNNLEYTIFLYIEICDTRNRSKINKFQYKATTNTQTQTGIELRI